MRLKVIKALVFGALYLSFSTYALEPLKMAGKETLYQRSFNYSRVRYKCR